MNIEEAIKGFQCPICGNVDSYRLRDIDKMERVGNNTVLIPITIGQCDFCGEQIMDADTTTKVFEAEKEAGRRGAFWPRSCWRNLSCELKCGKANYRGMAFRLPIVAAARGRRWCLLHGTAEDQTRWIPILRPLAQRFTVYAIDRRGRNESGDRERYSLQEEADDVLGILDALNEPAHVLSHSYGALCLMEAAVRADRLGKLIFYEPPVPQDGNFYPPGSIEGLGGAASAGRPHRRHYHLSARFPPSFAAGTGTGQLSSRLACARRGGPYHSARTAPDSSLSLTVRAIRRGQSAKLARPRRR